MAAAVASLCSSSSSSSNNTCSSLSPAAAAPPHHHHPFTPIQECEREGKEDEEEEDDDEQKKQNSVKLATAGTCGTPPHKNNNINYVHQPTPLHSTKKKKRSETSEDRGVSCNRCRPNISSRDKFSVVPLDTTTTAGRLSITSPNALFKSIFSSINVVKKSPASSSSSSSSCKSAHQGLITPPASKLEWKNHRAVAAELSQKLIHATKKRDEAVLEASRLKSSVTQLEKKLNKLEIYCHNLRSGLDDCANHHEPRIKIGDQDRVIEHFLVAVSESRSSMRHLTRSLTPQTQGLSDRIHQHLLLLQPPPTNPRLLVFYLEALLNRAFFQDFESPGFLRSGPNRTLNPIHRCQSNFDSFTRLKELTWEEVLNKGTKQFSEEFSRFCDRKMSEVVTILGWTRPWPEPLLQAFFGASKAVWLLHLLANSVHPGLPIFRVDKGVPFDSVYMEDFMGAGDQSKKSPTVRVMVEPGFYIYGNVVKCKVICRYHNHTAGLTNVSPNTNHS
uniref:IRK-interacting protein n=1 Tax=Erigeron canadensis TaxID=72917 RepID=UPI001CB91DD0|nr:IRK-interacting protein [Erigeron canadensis]